MHGDQLYAFGITVKYGYAGNNQHGWWATVHFEDCGFYDRGSVQGELTTKYADDLSYAIDTIKVDAESMGIQFVGCVPDAEDERFSKPDLFYEKDGCSQDYPSPNGWREILKHEAERIGFSSPYEG